MISTALPHVVLSRQVAGNKTNTEQCVMNPYDGGCDYACMYCPHGRRSVTKMMDMKKYVSGISSWCKSNKGQHVLIGSHAECMGPSEVRNRYTEVAIHVFDAYKQPYSVITKSILVGTYVDHIPIKNVQMTMLMTTI